MEKNAPNEFDYIESWLFDEFKCVSERKEKYLERERNRTNRLSNDLKTSASLSKWINAMACKQIQNSFNKESQKVSGYKFISPCLITGYEIGAFVLLCKVARASMKAKRKKNWKKEEKHTTIRLKTFLFYWTLIRQDSTGLELCNFLFCLSHTLSLSLFLFLLLLTMYNYLFWNVPSACRCVYYAVMYTVVWQCSTSGGEHYNAVLHPLFARSTHVYPSIKKTFRSLRPKPGLENIS